MKARDYLFWSLLTFTSLFIGHQFRSAEQHASPASRPAEIAPRATLVSKATYWLALWRLAHGAPQSPALFQHVQELPDAVVNAPPSRLTGDDGEPLLDHSAGW